MILDIPQTEQHKTIPSDCVFVMCELNVYNIVMTMKWGRHHVDEATTKSRLRAVITSPFVYLIMEAKICSIL